MLGEKPQSAWSTPDGVFFACGAKPGKLAILFPGQGSQYTGMLRDLACSFPPMLDTLASADDGFAGPAGERLSDIIYPVSAFTGGTKESREEALRATASAQPAIGAVSLGLYKVLQDFGVIPDILAGHSYGELTALCAAGRLDETALHELSRLRGRLMGEGKGDRGGMLAVSASLTKVQQVMAEERLELVIANRNAPTQAVLSGNSSEINRAEAAFSSRNLTCKRLTVAAAFHSPLVADAAAPFLAELDKIDLMEGELPVYANSTAAAYPADPVAAKSLLAYQLAKPVEFVAEIEAMYAAGVRTFVEVGPAARLTGLVRAILGERPHTVMAVDASAGKRSGIADLARTLAQLAAGGINVRLSLWDEGYRAPENTARKPVMTVPICGANYVKPRLKRPPVSAVSQSSNIELPAVVTPVKPIQTAPALSASSRPLSRETLADSLRQTRESMVMLQKMQEDTARLHQRFLEGQETAARTFQTLLEQQRRFIQGEGHPAAEIIEQRPITSLTPGGGGLGWGGSGPDQSRLPHHPPPAPLPSREGEEISVNGIAVCPVAATLLAVVSEKTGYPVEMLEMEMGMDSDLGIDSIKRVEILSAIRERLPGAPLIGPEHLGTLRTLGEIAAHLGAGSESGTGAVSATNVGGVAEQPFTLHPSPFTLPPAQVTTLSADSGSVVETLLAVVSEKTGYPVEMLEMEMGMDSDLGIDSIKRVEILSAIRERLPGAPLIGPEHLGTLRTLGEIAAHLGAGSESATGAPSAADAGTVAEQPFTLHPSPLTLPSAPPAIGRSAVLPVTLDDGATAEVVTLADDGEFWVTDDGSPFAADLCVIIQGRGLNVRRVYAAEANDIDLPEKISGLVIAAPLKGTDDLFLENAFLLLKNTAPALRRAAATGGAICATVSRLDGSFGCAPATILTDPLSGGLAGLAKTAAREWPEINFRAIDLGEFGGTAAMARALAGELFRRGPLEVGLTHHGRVTLDMVELTAAPANDSSLISRGDVVIMTGGGRGVTAATAVALTEACRPLLLLLGRSPEPATEPSWLSNLGEESQIKRSIIEHAGGKLHPRDIEERYRAIVAGREVRATLDRIAASGGQAIYRSVDIRDGRAVSAILDEIRRDHGPVRGIIHGAGILADRLITDKSREQFALVYSTKVEGLRSLLSATREDDLRFLAIFSSITGRFGRVGQVDYAVANEALNKLAQAEARRRPGCRAVSINWGPWDGGMVTPALKKVFAAEGIGLIGLKEGGEFLIREIAATDAPVEIVAMAGKSGKPETVSLPTRALTLAEAFSMNLTVDDYPFLRSHVLDGKAVLPMAVIVEWLAHGALHGNPGFRFHGFNDLRICKGVVFGQETSCALQVMAGRAEKRDTFYLVPVELSGTGLDGRAILHARAEIVLATRLPEGIRSIIEIPATPYLPPNGELYDRERLFHGPELHGIEQVIGCAAKGIAALVKGAPPPAGWIRQPLRSIWITDPLVLDSAFQLMILWSFERFGAGSLPCFAGRYRQFIEAFPREGVQVVIRVTAEREQSATADMEFLDRHSGKLVARLEDYECIIDPSLKQAFQRNQLAQPGPVQLGAA
jgi:malonyl CoA-acyl carrier protein transacylase